MEQVILVNDKDEFVGTVEKMKAHQEALLHRAFSVFIFNSEREMLLQKRAQNKYHSGGLWTNACCSHPKPEEDVQDAAQRRLQEEMGFTCILSKIFNFTYKTSFDNGLTEFEYDHVFGGLYNGAINLNKNEAEEYAYQPVSAIEKSVEEQPHLFTVWFIIAFPKVKEWLNKHPGFFKD